MRTERRQVLYFGPVGCWLPIRTPGKGDHEIWYARIKPRHWADWTLMPKAF